MNIKIFSNVETIPTIIRSLKDLRCCDGDAVTLECLVEAKPEPNVFWEKDGKLLSSSHADGFIMSYDGLKAMLTIPRIYPEDQGEYTCIAKNNIGQAFSSACIIVDVPEEKENLLHKQLSRPLNIYSNHSTPISTPRATPNRSMTPSSRRLSYRHTSIDYCTNFNRLALASPKFLALPENKVAEEGETVRFQCVIYGNPMPWSTWDKDLIIMTPTKRITIQERNDLRFIEIDEVTFEDAGLYRITVENEYGRVEATARLDVIGNTRNGRSSSKRRVTASPYNRNLSLTRRLMGSSTAINGRLTLSCSHRGSSVPARNFYHNGEEIQESSNCQILMTDEESTLIIDHVSISDEGIYTCVAQNEFGLITSSIPIKFFDIVNDIPEPIFKIKEHLPETLNCFEGAITNLTFEIFSSEPYKYDWYKNGELVNDSTELR